MPLPSQFLKRIVMHSTLIFIVPWLMAQTEAQTGEANRGPTPPPVTVTSVSSEAVPYVPMTQKDRLKAYGSHLFNAESILRDAAGAGINQAVNTPAEWRQGAEGYGRRFASVFGGHIVQSTIMYGVSAPLHEDNRYFRSGLTGFGPRLKYALTSSFMARHDDGSRHISISRLTSYAATAAISRTWQPRSTDKPIYALDSFGVSMGVEMGFNIAREFLPGLLHSRAPVTMSQNPAR